MSQKGHASPRRFVNCVTRSEPDSVYPSPANAPKGPSSGRESADAYLSASSSLGTGLSPRPGRVFFCSLFTLLCVVRAVPGPAHAQESPCDAGLERRARGAHGYALRGERCEGIYVEEVGGTVLAIASFTDSFQSYDSTSGQTLIVEWTAPGGDSLWLRARGIRRDLYYQMDAVRSSGEGSYRWEWPKDILVPQRIGRGSLGVVGWTRRTLGDLERDVFVPLRLTEQGEETGDGRYELVLFPGARLAEVYITLAAMDPNGQPRHFIRQDEPLQYGYYPAERPIRIPISDLHDPGIYYLGIGARLERGGSVALTHWIYHPGS